MTAALQRNSRTSIWPAALLLVLGLWLGGSLVLDLLVVPSLSAAGMMSASGFASAGYELFGIFNHLELLAAATVLSGFWAIAQQGRARLATVAIAAMVLVCVAFSTYVLTPQMGATALPLDWLTGEPTGMPAGMVSMHVGYWANEALKLAGGAFLLGRCFQLSFRS